MIDYFYLELFNKKYQIALTDYSVIEKDNYATIMVGKTSRVNKMLLLKRTYFASSSFIKNNSFNLLSIYIQRKSGICILTVMPRELDIKNNKVTLVCGPNIRGMNDIYTHKVEMGKSFIIDDLVVPYLELEDLLQ